MTTSISLTGPRQVAATRDRSLDSQPSAVVEDAASDPGLEPTAPQPQNVVVGLGDLAVLQGPAGRLTTFALGSCVAVILYDRQRHVGGLLHAFLPDGDDERYRIRVKRQPTLFVRPGLSLLVEQVYALRNSNAPDLVAKMAGGASLVGHSGGIAGVGRANVEAARATLRSLHIRLVAEDVGEHRVRSAYLDLETGRFVVHTHGHGEVVL